MKNGRLRVKGVGMWKCWDVGMLGCGNVGNVGIQKMLEKLESRNVGKLKMLKNPEKHNKNNRK